MIHINLMPREMARRQAAWLRYRNYIAIALLAFATLLLAAESESAARETADMQVRYVGAVACVSGGRNCGLLLDYCWILVGSQNRIIPFWAS